MEYIVSQVGKFKMKLEKNGGGIQKTLRGIHKHGKEREPELLYVLRQEIKQGMTCLDLGANIGYITLLMCDLVGPNGSVYAVEPDPRNYKLLKANIAINGYTEVVEHLNIGISDRDGKLEFWQGKTEGNLGSVKRTKKSANTPINISVLSLDSYCKLRKFPELIKMDVEGHEVEILYGFLNSVAIHNFPCKIIMELHPTLYSSGKKMEIILRAYLNHGFKTKYVISAGVPQPDLFKKWGYEPVKTFRSGRGLYNRFSNEHMIQACCYENMQPRPDGKNGPQAPSPKIARYLMLERG